jgi:hypothetical protein
MSAGKWPLFVLAVLAAVTAGLSTLPYGWAHVTATALAAAVSAYTTAAALVIHATGKSVNPPGKNGV